MFEGSLFTNLKIEVKLSFHMKSFIKLARQPEIVRTTQKDFQYTSEINQNVLDVSQFLFTSNRFRISEFSQIISNISYHAFAAVNRLQTLGEEYTGVIQISKQTDKLPSKLLQTLAIVLEFAGETFLLKVLKIYEQKVEENDDLLPEARNKLLKLLQVIRSSLPYIKVFHRGLFYFNSGHFQLSKRLTGINYVLVRFWLNENHPIK